ncbi:hypothetical protein [Erythrobacter sp.]|uniref:hypothetical protein n=1 Tax=Erythrobacter sp. TaxID=1042 RepID=UPI0025F34EFC|nr:hypothetical protein [Erythrobacter sp.]
MAYGKNETAERIRQLLKRPRNLALTGPLMSIIVNAFLVLVAIAGLVAVANGVKAGQQLVFAAMVWSTTHTLIVRAKHGGNEPLDERERALATEAAAVGGYTTSLLAAIWCLLLGIFADYGMWFPQSAKEWLPLGYFMIGLMTQTTNIATAWRTPPYAAELLDEE